MSKQEMMEQILMELIYTSEECGDDIASLKYRAKQLLKYDDWIKAEIPTEFDGYYQCVIEKVQECGAVHQYQAVVYNSSLEWLVKDGEKVTHYSKLYSYPKKDKENIITL